MSRSACSCRRRGDLDRGKRHRDRRAAAGHRIAEHDAVRRHDVEIERVGDEARIVLGTEALPLMAAFAEIEGLLGDHPAAGHVPLGARLGFGPGGEHAGGRRLVTPLQPDGAVLGRSRRHVAASLALERRLEIVEQGARAVLARAGVVVAVEKDRLLGIHEPGAPAGRLELDRAERHRDARARPGTSRRSSTMRSFGHDVLVDRVVGVDRAARRAAAHALAAADAEVELEASTSPIRRGRRTSAPWPWVGKGGEDARRRRGVAALDGEGGVGAERLVMVFLRWFRLVRLVSARKSPSRSRRRSQLARRSLIQRSAVRSAVGSMRQVRTRPTFSDRTRPLASSTCEVLHHRRQRHVERPGELADRRRAAAQPLHHDPPGRVGQRLEGEIERGGGCSTSLPLSRERTSK